MKAFPFLVFCAAAGWAGADITAREVSYEAGSVQAKGWLAMPKDAKGPVPGVLVVHEWWGHNAYARKRAEMLAGLGYAALAVDMYGDGKTAGHPKEAGEFAGAVRANLPEARKRFEGAMKFLASQEGVSQDGMAAIGYCFGGSIVLQMAIDRVEGLVAVASFHGSLGLDYSAPKEPVTARVLVCNGAADVFIPQEQIDAFQEEMKARKAEMKFVSLPGAKHSFTNPDADRFAKEFGMDIAYQKKADEDSWAEMKALFAGVFAR